MNKEFYETPKLTVELFETEDVITTSDPDGEGWTDFYPINFSARTSSGR